MAANNKRPVLVIFLILFFGCVVGTALSQLLGAIFPEGVVKDFFSNRLRLDGEIQMNGLI